jgi:hypothetical protein
VILFDRDIGLVLVTHYSSSILEKFKELEARLRSFIGLIVSVFEVLEFFRGEYGELK